MLFLIVQNKVFWFALVISLRVHPPLAYVQKQLLVTKTKFYAGMASACPLLQTVPK